MSSVVTFYQFVALDELQTLRAGIEEQARSRALTGTVLLAGEGINGTLSGPRPSLEGMMAWLRARPSLVELPCRYSMSAPDNRVFHRLKVRIKSEIVKMGRPEVEVAARTGTHVDVQRWHELLDDPEVLVVDTRNDYEIAIGTFPGAVNPRTRSFREFPAYVSEQLDPARRPRIAMFCTGGVRCEKASAYLLEQGFEEVYQLDGGVLSYLEAVDGQSNRWQGECFVFDQRVSVDRDLEQGSYSQCFACRSALSEADLRSAEYVEGVSCPHCAGQHSPRQRAAFAERARQEALAAARGSRHVGQAFLRRNAARQEEPRR